ncbi:MAG TPA: 3-deoxy-7-phosphoheptulonate synthase, partial [Ruminococcaceae bacterium]|nr:3-deoxy-7-phosphoheptulonate synthase [Oscillospiraceae bacterium]
MVIVLKQNPDGNKVEELMKRLRGMGLDIHQSQGQNSKLLGLVGDTSAVDIDALSALEIVETVKRIQEPYKNANRKFHPNDTVIEVGGAKIGGGNFSVIAGPCSVESRDQLCSVAADVKAAGASMLRGGAFKPRTSPYAFQGLRGEGIKLLLEAKKETGLPIVTEIMDLSQLYLFEEVDVIQVGARNMQNFEMLK